MVITTVNDTIGETVPVKYTRTRNTDKLRTDCVITTAITQDVLCLGNNIP